MNQRTKGLVKQRRKRAQKRRDIRAGRKLSMQQMLQNTHNHTHVQDLPVVHVDHTHELVRIDQDGEVVVLSGTQSRLRGMRTKLMAGAREGESYSVRKIKVVA